MRHLVLYIKIGEEKKNATAKRGLCWRHWAQSGGDILGADGPLFPPLRQIRQRSASSITSTTYMLDEHLRHCSFGPESRIG